MLSSSVDSASNRFQHEAVFYRGLDDLAAAAVPFIREGLERQEPVLVAVIPDRIRSLRCALGSDADEVTFLNMAEAGGNPARIIPVWRHFLEDSMGAASVRGIGEPVWSGRSEVELEECRLHESLLNVAFDTGPAWRLMCPYDADALPAAVVEDAMRTHPVVTAEGGAEVGYGGHAYARDSFASPLSPVPDTARRISFGRHDLVALRGVIRTWALEAGLSDHRAALVVLAAHELATNSVVHAGGEGVLTTWNEPGDFVLEVSDQGHIPDPLVGRNVVPGTADGGRGVWIVNQLCDLVQVRSLETGTVVRLHSWV